MSKKRKRLFLIAGGAVLILAVVLAQGFDTKLITQTYQVETDKIDVPVRLALLTDLHCCAYGEGQRELLDAVGAQAPDIVLLGGDIVDDDPSLPVEHAAAVVSALSQRYPVYYVTGNHEFWSGEVDQVREMLSAWGARVLAGESDIVEIRGQAIQICGVDDPDVGEAEWSAQLDQVTETTALSRFAVLLTHRPERVDEYRGRGFDLILAGHAHGGQWRLPGLINGLFAPNQGLFPAYAGGRYAVGSSTLIVSRGLARESTRIPRIFNPPELVMIEILPDEI